MRKPDRFCGIPTRRSLKPWARITFGLRMSARAWNFCHRQLGPHVVTVVLTKFTWHNSKLDGVTGSRKTALGFQPRYWRRQSASLGGKETHYGVARNLKPLKCSGSLQFSIDVQSYSLYGAANADRTGGLHLLDF